jgi:hypothetical protein
MRSLNPRHRSAAVAVMLAFAIAGCGGSGHSNSSAPGVSTPPSTAGLEGNGQTSQAAGICQSFVTHANLVLQNGIERVPPEAGAQLYSLLEGLSRRLEFLSGPAPERARVAGFAQQLDRAAATAQAMGAENASTKDGVRRFEAKRAELASQLTAANVQARRIGVGACAFNLGGQPPPR